MPDLTVEDLAAALATLDIYRKGWSYQETAQQIIDELDGNRDA